MFINKANGRNNLCGIQIALLRTERGISQRKLADALQDYGLNIGKNQIQRIENGDRFVTDIELLAFAAYFRVSVDMLITGNPLAP